MKNPHDITKDFEKELSRYTGAPFVACVDNCSNALFLALYYEKNFNPFVRGLKQIVLPANTYPAVPCEVKHAGFNVNWQEFKTKMLKGAYNLYPTKVWDSALSFTADMYKPNTFMCLSFTGAYKHLKLGKGGAILTDDEKAYKWFKKARFSGRSECSYHEDNFDANPVIGWNFYMPHETAARGLMLMNQFYNLDGTKKHNEDIELPYPDLSQFKIYQ